MKAFFRDRYGPPQVLEFRNVEQPEVPDGGVLIQVRAASVNAYDCHMLRGKPYLMRLGEGLRKPKKRAILGHDVAGIVCAVAPGVTQFREGDRVFGCCTTGAFAEYASGTEFVAMPRGSTFEEAATIPTAGLTALQGLRDIGGLVAGQRVLITGAGGGVGTFAVQVAKALGATVSATTSTDKIELVLGLGADHMVDYAREDVTKREERYDLIFDVSGTHSLRQLRRILTPSGTLVLVAPGKGEWVGVVARLGGAVVMSRLVGQSLRPFMAKVRSEDLLMLRSMVQSGAVTPVIDRTYPFTELPEAFRYAETGRASGKVVVVP